jgi:pyruvate/2-oxoglutarate dehydrogenase complex dihydrolipoamide acyltransferase (E2) component
MSTPVPPELRDAIEEILHDATSRLLEVMARQQEQWLAALEQQLALADTTLRERRVILESLRQATAASRGSGAQAPGSQASAASAASAPAASAASANAPWPPAAGASPRAARVRTADVVEDLRALLTEEREGLRLGTLRERTGYGNMQLHRALVQLEETGELTRKGAHRKTVYKPTRRLRRPRGRAAPAPPANATPTPAPSPSPSGGSRKRGRRPSGAGEASPSRARSAGARQTSAAGRRGAQRTRTEDVKKAVVRVLRNRKKGLLMADLCALTGYTDKQLHRAIGALAEQGRIRKTGSSRSMRYALKRAR